MSRGPHYNVFHNFLLRFYQLFNTVGCDILTKRTSVCYLELGDSLIEPRIKCSKIASVEDSLVYLLGADAVFDVMVENEIIAHEIDFINVLAIMVASYYDFNIEYK